MKYRNINSWFRKEILDTHLLIRLIFKGREDEYKQIIGGKNDKKRTSQIRRGSIKGSFGT